MDEAFNRKEGSEMKTKTLLSMGLTFSVIFMLAVSQSPAQSNPVYVQFSPGAVKGALYTPDSGPAPHVGILNMHRTSNRLGHISCRELSARGFMVLCMNPRFDNNEALVNWETVALDVRSGVNFLKAQPGITKVLLLGGSGGGPSLSFYQAVAENGPSYCQGPNKLVQCGNNLAGLPPADGIIFRDAHPGNPVNGVRSINPAVVSEQRPDLLNPTLDPFNPDNGYNPDGASVYSEEFKQQYFAAQAARMNKLIDTALKRLSQIGDDDDIFLVPRGDGARLMQLDPSIHHSTISPQKLLKNDGTIVTQIVESVRLPNPELAQQNATFNNGTRLLTVRSFLSANATRGTNSMDGVDWCSTNNSTVCAVQAISVPMLVVAMGAHYFIRDNEMHYELAASVDKDFIVIEGATHGITPCVPCEQFPGQYSNTVENFFNYVAEWINARF
jgi:hypothetical protein